MNGDTRTLGFKNILVTGGCGFIGSNFIRYLYHKYPDYRIFNVDLLTYAGNLDSLVDIEKLEAHSFAGEKRYTLVYGDICDERLLDILFSRHHFQMVINFAAETHVDRSIINMSDFIRTNIGGVRAIIEAVRKHQVPRFVHVSTDEIYGSVENGYANEEAPLRPSNPYSSSKAAADLIVQSFIRTHQVPAMIVRGSNNYGPYQYPEKLIPLVITNLIQGKKIPIHGDGHHVRSWLHVEDFSSAIDLVAHRAAPGSIYNVSGEERTNLEILAAIAGALNLDLENFRDYVPDRPGADLRYAVDAGKLQTELGWAPEHTLDKSLVDVVNWYVENPEWWKKIKERSEFTDHYQKQAQGQWS